MKHGMAWLILEYFKETWLRLKWITNVDKKLSYVVVLFPMVWDIWRRMRNAKFTLINWRMGATAKSCQDCDAPFYFLIQCAMAYLGYGRYGRYGDMYLDPRHRLQSSGTDWWKKDEICIQMTPVIIQNVLSALFNTKASSLKLSVCNPLSIVSGVWANSLALPDNCDNWFKMSLALPASRPDTKADQKQPTTKQLVCVFHFSSLSQCSLSFCGTPVQST